jgi:hypothetical protein
MVQDTKSLTQRINLWPLIEGLLFFSALFLFVLLYVDPRVIDSLNGVNKYSYVLELTRGYFTTAAATPGAAARIGATLMVLACGIPWLGALLITLVAWGLCKTGELYVKHCARRIAPLYGVRFIPAILFLLLLSRYSMGDLPAVLGVLGMSIFAIVYQRLHEDSVVWRCSALCLLTALSFYLFSSTAVLFLALAVIADVLVRRKRLGVVLVVASCLGALLILCRLMIFPFDRIINYRAITDVKGPLLYLFLFVPVLAVIGATMSALLSKRKKGEGQMPGKRHKIVLLRCGLDLAVALVFAVTALGITSDWTLKNARELGLILYYDRAGAWDELLKERSSFIFDEFPKNQSRTALIASNAIYRALYHTGQLGSNLFSFPQASSPEPLLLNNGARTIYFPAWVAGIEIAADLGAVNYGEKIAGEAMENMGPLPPILYQRALFQAAKGNSEVAEVYLNKLKNMSGNSAAAGMLLRDLSPVSILNNPSVIRLTEYLDSSDYVLETVSEETMLLSLLNRNRHNKMAFEYLMTYYLLTHQPGKVAHALYRLDDFDYTEIPLHYEEAVEIYRRTDSAAVIAMLKLAERPETSERCDKFLAMADQCQQGVPGAEELLRKQFGASYFYFYSVGVIMGEKK